CARGGSGTAHPPAIRPRRCRARRLREQPGEWPPWSMSLQGGRVVQDWDLASSLFTACFGESGSLDSSVATSLHRTRSSAASAYDPRQPARPRSLSPSLPLSLLLPAPCSSPNHHPAPHNPLGRMDFGKVDAGGERRDIDDSAGVD